MAIAANGGVTVISASTAAVTWSVAVPTISPDVALTMKVPAAVAVQGPLLLQVARVLVLGDQVTEIETSLPTLSKPLAVNVWLPRRATAAEEGLTGVVLSLPGSPPV